MAGEVAMEQDKSYPHDAGMPYTGCWHPYFTSPMVKCFSSHCIRHCE
jgi:hypothetical protein